MKQKKAAEVLGLGVRQAQRLLKGYRTNGVEELISKKVDKPSNNRLSRAVKGMGIFLIRKHYPDFGGDNDFQADTSLPKLFFPITIPIFQFFYN